MKDRIVKIVLFSFVLFAVTPAVFGQDHKGEIVLEIPLYFGVGGASLDGTNAGNIQNLGLLNGLISDEIISKDTRVTISAYASPDGNYAYNMNLSKQRLAELKRVFKRYDQDYPAADIIEDQSGFRWIMLYEKVLEDQQTPERAKILSLLANTSLIPTLEQDTTYAGALRRLKWPTWEHLYKKKFPYMRAGVIKIAVPVASVDTDFLRKATTGSFKVVDVFGKDYDAVTNLRFTKLEADMRQRREEDAKRLQAQMDSLATARLAAEQARIKATEEAARLVAEQERIKAAEEAARLAAIEAAEASRLAIEKKPLFALKTNLLYDVLSLVNLELEVPIGPRWSIAGEVIFPWWTMDNAQADSQRNRLHYHGANLEGKCWFGDRSDRPQMTGWFAGLYTGAGLYDLEYQAKGYQGEFFVMGGLSGGFAHTINKSGSLRMEYSFGVGYLQTDYRYYESFYDESYDSPENPHSPHWHPLCKSNGKFQWIGPTKLKVSLVWMLNRKIKIGGIR